MKSLKKTSWTVSEEEILFKNHKLIGNKWSQIAKFLPGRSENDIKNRWNVSNRKLKVAQNKANHQNVTISENSNDINPENMDRMNHDRQLLYTAERFLNFLDSSKYLSLPQQLGLFFQQLNQSPPVYESHQNTYEMSNDTDISHHELLPRSKTKHMTSYRMNEKFSEELDLSPLSLTWGDLSDFESLATSPFSMSWKDNHTDNSQSVIYVNSKIQTNNVGSEFNYCNNVISPKVEIFPIFPYIIDEAGYYAYERNGGGYKSDENSVNDIIDEVVEALQMLSSNTSTANNSTKSNGGV